jgi:glycosyltransferase involved in cell wall biosynthesis
LGDNPLNLLILPRYGRLGASSRLRFYQYIPYLEAHGVQVTVIPLLDDIYLKGIYAGRPRRPHRIASTYLRRLGAVLRHKRYDLIWLQYELFPWLPAWVEALLARVESPYVADYDDAIFHKYEQHTLTHMLLGKKIDAVMHRSVLVTAGNDYLAERARQAGAQRITHMPTVIDLDRYQISPPTGSAFTIGWIGTPTTAPYLRLVQPALAEVCQDGNTRFVLVGAKPLELEGVPTTFIPWTEKTEVASLQCLDAGIMPLEDTPWERGKCGYKLLQYMACGKPVIASSVGANVKIVEDGVNGFLAQGTDGWIKALRTLKHDVSLRARMGLAGRTKVETEYCLQVTAPKLLTQLSDVAQGKFLSMLH